MKNLSLMAGLALSLLPLAVAAAPTHHAMKPPAKAAAMYQCQSCHMKVTAAVAKKDHFKDPMDSGTLTPVKAAKK